MLNSLSAFADQILILNLFRYITFRTGGAMITALAISFILGPILIEWLKKHQQGGQPIRDDGPESHILTKAGTPTMGGFLILIALILSTALWADLSNGYIWAALGVTIGYGIIGFIDDYLKVTKRHHKGLSGKLKLSLQIIIALAAALWIMKLTRDPLSTSLAIPFFKDVLLDLGWFFIPFAAFVMVGASNAVNLTDGLDGLAIGPVLIAAAVFGMIAYLTGNSVFSNYLQVHYVPGAGELSIFLGALMGASLGFLWYNAPPAMVFMGDTGSLSLGGALGTVSVITTHELVLALVGGLFVLETVISYKLTGKRVFQMAPLHHHFEKKGWAEPTIVIRFWIIATILALAGLATLKLR